MMTDLFEEVKRHYEIVSFISQYLKLKKVGRNYLGLCPFHSEKTPSFTVSPEKQIFKCFGCGASGDVVTFYMKYKGLDFKEALLELAERAGLKIEKRYFAERKRERSLIELNYRVAKFYQHLLWNHPSGERARLYLKERGLSEETAKTFMLGYAPAEGRVLASFLRASQLDLEMAQEAGLLKRGEDGSYLDLFRERLIFPIFNEKGECVGFGGRALDSQVEPKYLNSPESKVFKKSEVLYGLFQSKEFIKKEGALFIVEGYFDFLTLWDRGLKNLSATCGTALTQEHLKRLKPLSEEIFLLFDGDEAGKKASLRALSLMVKSGLLPKVVLLPSGEDPDSFVKGLPQGISLKEELSRFTVNGLEFLWNYYKEAYQKSPSRVFNEICEVLQGVEDPILSQQIARELSFYLGLPEIEIEKRIRVRGKASPWCMPEEASDRETCFMRIIAQYLVNYPEDWLLLKEAGLEELLEDERRSPYHLFLKSFMEYQAKGECSLFEVPDPFIQEILSDLLFSPPFEDKEEVLKDIQRFIALELKKREIKKVSESLKRLERLGRKEEIEGYLFRLKGTLNFKEF